MQENCCFALISLIESIKSEFRIATSKTAIISLFFSLTSLKIPYAQTDETIVYYFKFVENEEKKTVERYTRGISFQRELIVSF